MNKVKAIDAAYREFCTRRFPLPTERQVSDLEKRIGTTLPRDYRRFLLEFNGGCFSEPDILPPEERCPLDRLTFMHGIGATHRTAELARKSDLAIFDDNDPPQIVPIGCTVMGSLVLLVTHPGERGSIVLKQAFGESFFLAHRIKDFFGLLQEASDD